MNGGQRTLTLLLGGASDALCLDVSANLARALDRDPTATRGDADWTAEAGDVGGQPVLVEVSRLPFEREDPARRRRLLDAADVVVVVADATDEAIPVAIAGLADVRIGLSGGARPIMLFGVSGASGAGLEPEELRRQLELRAQDVVLVGPANDRGRLRQMFAFAVRAAATHTGALTAPVAPAAPTSPASPATAEAAGRVRAPNVMALAPPPAPEPSGTTEVQVFGADDVYIEAVLNPAVVSADGAVQIASSHWEALAELVGELALIRGSGDDRRAALMRELLGARLIVDRRELTEAGDVDLFNQPVVSAAAPGQQANAASGTIGDDQSPDDRFRALKELRRQLLG